MVRPVAGTPGGGPSDSSMRPRSASSRSALTSVNLTTRTYMAAAPGSDWHDPTPSRSRVSDLEGHAGCLVLWSQFGPGEIRRTEEAWWSVRAMTGTGGARRLLA